MVTTFKSHSLNTLGAHFAKLLENAEGGDPFSAAQVIVPNLETSRWLKLLLAERNGFAGNMDFILPAEWQWRQIRKLHPQLPKLLPSDPMPMSWAIFSLLMDEEIISRFPVLQSYIKKQNSDSSEQVCWQLARQLSAVYDQYLVYRPQMITRWQKQGAKSEEEKWQAEFWKILDNRWKVLHKGTTSSHKAELYNEVLTAISRGEVRSEKTLYIFNPGLIPVPILKLMQAAGRQSDLCFFMMQPAPGMSSPGFNPENELVESLANEAWDIHQTLADIVSGESIDVQADQITEENNLNRVQKSIIRNEKVPGLAKVDESMNIHACHSELREVETLHRFLLNCFQENPELSPDDVLVSMPDPERYMPFIKAVFGAKETGLPGIPFYISGNSSGTQEIIRAFEHLLNLPDSRFSFREVMDFVQLYPVLKKLGLSESSVDMIKQWFRDNHVVWGLDASHRGEEGQPEDELQTWREALRRGWMGQLTGGEPGDMNNGSLVYRGIRSGDQQQVWVVFSRLITQLKTTRNECRRSRTCGEWVDLFETWIERFFPGDEAESEKLKLIGAIEKIRKEAETADQQEAISFAIIRSVLLEALDTPGAGSAMFTRGVLFSSMVPVRSLPFKVIALLGLNDDVFPRKPVHPDFDLMAKNPKKGERNRKNEDRNLFLESVLTAEKIHYCSYIGKSQKDDEPIPPSPILSEWVDVLSKASNKKPDQIITTERLYGFSSAYFTGAPSSWSMLYMETAKSVGKGENSGFNITASLPEPEEYDYIDPEKLIRFYGNPVKGFLTERLGVRLTRPKEDSDEFTVDGLESHILFQQVFGWLLEGMEERQVQALLKKSGSLPSGWPGERKLHEIVQWAKRAFSEIDAKGYHAELSTFDISILLQENKLEGIIKNFSRDIFLDINPSRLSGKLLFEGWIRHLCLSVQFPDKDDSIHLCNLKKGNVKWHRFSKVENPRELLTDLITAYQEGLTKPLMFFPKTALKYIEKLPDEKGAAIVAEKEWKKINYQTNEEMGERSDPYISLLLGAEADSNFPEWGQTFKRFIKPMTDHMEEMK